MKLKYKLLEHPFYQAWTKGEITMEQLAKYHKSYADFIELIPTYWKNITVGFEQNDDMAREVIADEIKHIGLWNQLSEKLPEIDNYPKLTEVINELDKMNTSELLGAIQAFEIQQPEVALTKKKGLIENYGFNSDETEYFDEHLNEEAHINYGSNLKNRFADEKDFNKGFEKASEIYYKALDMF